MPTATPTRTTRCPLEPLERQALALLAEGRTRSQVGDTLDISPHTVKTLISRMLTKTDTRGTTHLVAVAVRNGWIK